MFTSRPTPNARLAHQVIALRARGRPAWRARLAAALLALAAAPGAQAQAEPFIGQMMLVPYNFCPQRWAPAEGQLLSIAQNTALFSLLGTYYGGDGRTTFGLPDLRGRTPVGVGTGPGLSPVTEGQVGGAETTTLNSNQLPPHTHDLRGTSQPATHAAPAGRALAATQNAGAYAAAPLDSALVVGSVGIAGGGQPIPLRNPYLGMRWCIALEGIFPSRN